MNFPVLSNLLLLTVLFSYFDLKPKQPEQDIFSHGKLKVSENKRFLQYQDGTPFFYLGDTAWELFHRLNKEEADKYLEDRAGKGFNVIQAVALAELDGHTVPNPYGYLPLDDLDPAQPAVREGADNDYWDHVDYIIDKANELGMYIGFLPTWGRYWHDEESLIFTPENARMYGEFLGRRYKDKNIIWILGGDREVTSDLHYAITRAMAEGIKAGDGGTHLISFHPRGARSSAESFHNDDWLDFNMLQNGHSPDYTNRYSKTLEDYNREPVKPVFDGEPLYEDHPLNFDAARQGHSLAADVRRTLYWNLFEGAFGHTYGHHSIWQMYDPEKKRRPVNNPLMSWKEALDQPGASQMIHGKKLMESRPFLTRIPDPSIIVKGEIPTSIPGEGRYRFVATRDTDGTYAMVYCPVGRSFTVNMKVIKGMKVKAWWYNPRNGEANLFETFDNVQDERTFISPDKGELTDWILVLDDAAFNYPAPGKE
ncbi:MAG: glycoside hydrolase family 140 protein [Proteiniphilum sp.]|jgi:hypothetical protein|uniref:glycoside hydrolase family 140 protein n=1 Tax=Proteiniphilum sp. TaxID=1926877 RepID=UPI002B21D36A|nr:glycoside hydrolase family 140 protein [Proteiniphilum sp.]MEA5127632.1 glycoside hydrolase family 140 protein [Proteiniphilum sp.]